jgi:hypothetical protein
MHPSPRCSKQSVGFLVILIVIAVAFPAVSEQEGWVEFSFDTSSDSYKRRGERSFDLKSGRYAASATTKSHSGDFITMISYSPEWVTFRTPDWETILFSTSEEHDEAVDKRAERVSDRVPVHYGDYYVASFGDRTYTIRLVEGGYEFPVGTAKFLYRPGGTPGPEHEPRKRASEERTGRSTREDTDTSRVRDRPTDSSGLDGERIDTLTGAEQRERRRSRQDRPAERSGLCESGCEGTGRLGQPRPVDKRGSPEPVEGYVRYIYVCVTTPSADDVSAEKATLTVELKGPKNFKLTRQNIRSGTTPTVKFLTFPVGRYEVIAKYAGETVSDTADLQHDCEDVALVFPGADLDELIRLRKEPERIDKVTVTIQTPESRGSGSPAFHPLTVTLNSTYEGGFSTMHRDDNAVLEGSVEVYTFDNVRPGTYSVKITYGSKTIDDTITINSSTTEFEFVVR